MDDEEEINNKIKSWIWGCRITNVPHTKRMILCMSCHMCHFLFGIVHAFVFSSILNCMHHSPRIAAVPEVVVGGEAEVGGTELTVWAAGIETCYISNKALCN
ncbi:hypothetical protein XENORESO_014329 [Xenotaenia resolanae]|uniref:Uncharacterized protein n=1 Tax=Xenotaenia resolanae TaxID=208358 RepID=A0ABV0WTH6_9TELE